MTSALTVFAPGALWLVEYFVSLGGARINARMTVIKLRDESVVLHSPCAFDAALTEEVSTLGRVAAIIAPGNFHWLNVRSCQRAFPDAVTYACPGTEKRAKGVDFDTVLSDHPPDLWARELSQVLVQGTRIMREVAFFHHASKTLILVDLIENVTAATHGTNLYLRLLFRALGMWNTPTPAPEYRLGWGDKSLVRESMKRILEWDFERVVVSHGDVITHDAKRVVTEAWQKLLG